MYSRTDVLERIAKVYSSETVAQIKPVLDTKMTEEEFIVVHIATCHAKGKPGNKRKCAKSLYRYLKKHGDIT